MGLSPETSSADEKYGKPSDLMNYLISYEFSKHGTNGKLSRSKHSKVKSSHSKLSGKPSASSEPSLPKPQPKKVKAEKIDMRQFKARGPLQMKSEFKGNVKHDLDQENSASLENLEFDKDLNSLVWIGTQIEKLM
ncbi:hypothetical protein GCK32_019615, partial [Trichostrongylus colubriformis]